MQQWAGLSQIRQIFHNSSSVCCYATFDVVSDQTDLLQHHWSVRCSAMGRATSDQTDLSQHQGCVCCSAMGRAMSDQTDLPQHQWAVLSDGQADHPLNHTAGLNQTHGPSRPPPETHDPRQFFNTDRG